MTPSRHRTFSAHDIAAEIVRRAGVRDVDGVQPVAKYVFVSDPPTAAERLEILAAGLQGLDVVAIPRAVMTVDEWTAHYCTSGHCAL